MGLTDPFARLDARGWRAWRREASPGRSTSMAKIQPTPDYQPTPTDLRLSHKLAGALRDAHEKARTLRQVAEQAQPPKPLLRLARVNYLIHAIGELAVIKREDFAQGTVVVGGDLLGQIRGWSQVAAFVAEQATLCAREAEGLGVGRSVADSLREAAINYQLAAPQAQDDASLMITTEVASDEWAEASLRLAVFAMANELGGAIDAVGSAALALLNDRGEWPRGGGGEAPTAPTSKIARAERFVLSLGLGARVDGWSLVRNHEGWNENATKPADWTKQVSTITKDLNRRWRRRREAWELKQGMLTRRQA